MRGAGIAETGRGPFAAFFTGAAFLAGGFFFPGIGIVIGIDIPDCAALAGDDKASKATVLNATAKLCFT